MAVGQTKLVDFGKRSGLKIHPVSLGAMRLPVEGILTCLAQKFELVYFKGFM